MGGADGSFSTTFHSTDRLAGFLMRARPTEGFEGMLYETASMESTEGKGVDGRGGYTCAH